MKTGTVVRILISLFFIGLLYYILKGEMREVFLTLKRTDLSFFGLAFFLQLIVIGIISFRLNLFFKAQGLPLVWKEVLELSFIGIFFNNFLPTAAGGDVVKAYYAFQKTRKKMESFTCVVADRIIGLFSMIFMATIGLTLLWGEIDQRIKATVVSLFTLSAFLLLFLFSRRMAKSIRFLFAPLRRTGLDQKIEKLYLSLHLIMQNKKLLWKSLALSVTSHCIVIYSCSLLIRGLSSMVPLARLCLMIPLISTVSMLPSVNGLGIREGAFVYFLSGAIGRGAALALSILWLGIMGIQSFIGALVYLLRRGMRASLKEVKTGGTL